MLIFVGTCAGRTESWGPREEKFPFGCLCKAVTFSAPSSCVNFTLFPTYSLGSYP